MTERPEHLRSELHQKILRAEFARRKKRNTSYSLRAFSRDLGISLTTLSGVLLKKRSLSRNNVQKLAERISLSPDLQDRMLAGHRPRESASHLLLAEDEFQTIASWYHLAILNLACLAGTSASSARIAARLGITPLEVEDALTRLQRLELLKIEDGRLIRTGKPLEITSPVPSSAIRNYHRENLELALEAIESVPMELRELASITFPADPELLPPVRQQIFRFKRRIARLLRGRQPSEVYTLAIQLFPVTRKKASP